MKTQMIIIAMLINISLWAQVSLKGIELGQPYYGPYLITTTLGNVKGQFFLSTLDDNRVYMITFMTSNDGVNISAISSEKIKGIIKGIENKFDISFRLDEPMSYDEHVEFLKSHTFGKNGYKVSKGMVDYFIDIGDNISLPDEEDFSFVITNRILAKMYIKQQQAEINADF